ncbi:MAG: phosphate-selective porin OprO/OprP [Candidatus Paceibacteria bacterium]|jgi:phosphate-selective porin OprO/OprP
MTLTQRTLSGTRAPGSRLLAVLLAALLMASSGSAQDAAHKDEIVSLKASVDSMQRQIDELKGDHKKIPVTGSSNATMKVFGRVQFDGWAFPQSDAAINVFETGDPELDPQNRVESRRSRIGVEGTISDNMVYKAAIDFAHPNSLAFKDMYIGFEDVPVLNTFLMGNQKRPYGLDALNSSRYNVFMERPFVNDLFNRNARRFGLASSGVSEDQEWNWRFGAYNMIDWQSTGNIVSYSVEPELAGRIATTPWYDKASEGRNYMHLAMSSSLAFPDGNPAPADAINGLSFRTRPEGRSRLPWINTGFIDGTRNYVLGGLEAVVNFGPTQIAAEYMQSWLDRTSGQGDVQFSGAYVYVSHFLTDDYMPWSRKSGTLGKITPQNDLSGNYWGAWQVAARYSIADFSDQDIQGGEGKALTLGLNWWWNTNARLQFNYSLGSISDRDVDVSGTSYSDGDYQLVGLRVMVDF